MVLRRLHRARQAPARGRRRRPRRRPTRACLTALSVHAAAVRAVPAVRDRRSVVVVAATGRCIARPGRPRRRASPAAGATRPTSTAVRHASEITATIRAERSLAEARVRRARPGACWLPAAERQPSWRAIERDVLAGNNVVAADVTFAPRSIRGRDRAPRRQCLSRSIRRSYRDLVRQALAEDVGAGRHHDAGDRPGGGTTATRHVPRQARLRRRRPRRGARGVPRRSIRSSSFSASTHDGDVCAAGRRDRARERPGGLAARRPSAPRSTSCSTSRASRR